MLEPRLLLSPTIFTVDSTASGTSGSGTSGTLPYVILQANANANTEGSEIEFDSSVFTSQQTITLGATLVLSETAGPDVIDGPTAGLTISGGGAVSVFEVESGVTASLSGLTISGGSTSGNGGGLDNNGTATLTDCTVSGSSAADAGGGVMNEGSGALTLTGCTISGNSAVDGGGGLANRGTATLIGCPISGNSEEVAGGGGLYNYGMATLTDCTISGNSSGVFGGGLSSFGGTTTLTNCTVSGNLASFGGGLSDDGTGVTALENSIVAGNTTNLGAASDIETSDVASSSSHNLIGTGGSGGLVNGVDGNIVGVANVLLAPLGNYGGPTQTIALLPGSAAIGAGMAVNGVTTDQRGEPLDSPPDIGAFQSQGFTLTPVAGSTPQQTTDGTAFANPLAVVVTANNPLEPVAGGTVTFTAPSSGASALTAGTATIGSDGSASVIAADNSIAGSYIVSASTTGAVAPVSFSLTNLVSDPVAAYTVNSTSGGFSGAGTSGTLPYVVFLASADANLSTDGSEIEFDPSVFSTTRTITLGATVVLSETAGAEVIDGPGAGLVTISGGGTVRVFQVESGVTATLSGLTISGGSTTGYGGGLYNNGTTTLTNCVVSGNSAMDDGGGLYNNGTTTLTGCTISGNSAMNSGGGLDNDGMANLTDCTISGNAAMDDGGGLANFFSDATLTLTNCTVTSNIASGGGGLYGGAATNLSNTIVAGNTVENGPADDIYGDTSSGSHNLIGTGGSGGITGGSDGNIVLTSLTALGLAPLGEYGGPTETVALLPGSAAIGAGTAASGITTDQRGEPLDSSPDIGAFQSQGFTINPVAGSTPQQTTDGTAFANPLAVVVTANNPLEPVANGTVTFAAPSSGASATLTGGTVTIGSNGSASVIAADNSIAGSYSVTASTTGAAAVSFSLTNLVSSLVSHYTVNSTSGGFSGSGTSGTLPYVIFLTNADANTSTDGTEIQFDSSVFSSPQTITLGATLVLSETYGPDVIDGPGAGLVTISGGGTSRVFQVDGMVTASISGLTIANGDDPSGGAIFNDGTLTISDSSISNNQATGYDGGGGIFNDGTMTISDSSIANNQATGSVSGGAGGGIFNSGTMTISDSSITNNQATGYGINGGGGISNHGTMTISGSSITNNQANSVYGGGGVFNSGVLTIDQSQISGNSGSWAGGLSQAYNNPGIVVITNSTFSLNVGSGIVNDSNMTIVNSTIADNSGNGIDTLAGGGENSLLLTIEDCTIVGNSSADLSNWDDLAPVTDVVVGNTIFSTISGDIASQGHNLIGDSSGGLGFVASDLLNVNPMLGALQNNGGPTFTEALLPGSPAIDAGSNALAVDPSTGLLLTTDQRGTGFPRIVNNAVDIGAFEVQTTWHFVVTVQPSASVTAGSGFGLTVTAEDSLGNVDSSFNGTVSVALYNNPDGASLGGILTVTAQSGVAAFSGLTLDKSSIGYTLLVSGSGETGATTNVFNVTPAIATQLVVTTQPPAASRPAMRSHWPSRPRIPTATWIPLSTAAWPSPC